jgi:hypothetical protein
LQCTTHVRFTPNSDRKSGFQQRAMSALPPKADVCSANRDVRFGPIADMRRAAQQATEASFRGTNRTSRLTARVSAYDALDGASSAASKCHRVVASSESDLGR